MGAFADTLARQNRDRFYADSEGLVSALLSAFDRDLGEDPATGAEKLRESLGEFREAFEGLITDHDVEVSKRASTEGSAVTTAIRKRSDATAEIERLASDIRKADPSISPEQARAKAIKSPEGREVRKAYSSLPVEDAEQPAAEPIRKTSAYTRLEQEASRIQKSRPGLTDAQAIREAKRAHPHLSASHRQERLADS